MAWSGSKNRQGEGRGGRGVAQFHPGDRRGGGFSPAPSPTSSTVILHFPVLASTSSSFGGFASVGVMDLFQFFIEQTCLGRPVNLLLFTAVERNLVRKIVGPVAWRSFLILRWTWT